MLDSLKKRPGSLRWAPRQKFGATEQGRAALAAYEEAISQYQARVQKDRQELERLQTAWAETHRVTPLDAAILAEFAVKDRLPREVQSSLDSCGTTLREVQAAVDRLYTAGLLAASGGGAPLPAMGGAGDVIDDEL
ncbi:MAG: hypothetical protein HY901_15185 [Deltaproteobacteria bacterium]|nr:hypothetical protein [Deltaproteobacteria bacterium]